MSTAKCVEQLIELTEYYIGESTPKDWKRLSKRNVDEQSLRKFEHRPTGNTYYFLSVDGEEDDGEHIEAGDFLFAINYYDDPDFGGLVLSVNPKSYWEKNHCLYDQHVMEWLEIIFDLDLDALGADEVTENQILLDVSREEAILILTAAGLEHSPAMEDFMSGTS